MGVALSTYTSNQFMYDDAKIVVCLRGFPCKDRPPLATKKAVEIKNGAIEREIEFVLGVASMGCMTSRCIEIGVAV